MLPPVCSFGSGGGCDKCFKDHVSKKDIEDLLKRHHAKLVCDLDSSIRQHLKRCFETLSAGQVLPFVENATIPHKDVELHDLHELETRELPKLPMSNTATNVNHADLEDVVWDEHAVLAEGQLPDEDYLIAQEGPLLAHHELDADTHSPPAEQTCSLKSSGSRLSFLLGGTEVAESGPQGVSCADQNWVPHSSDRSTARASIESVQTQKQLSSHMLTQFKNVRSVRSSKFTQSNTCRFRIALWAGPAIVVNSVFVGFRIGFTASESHRDSNMHMVLDAGSLLFCILFTGELLGKLCLTRMFFFTGRDKCWNAFDSIIVLLMWLDEVKRRTDAKFDMVSITWMSTLRMVHFCKDGMLFSSIPEWCVFRLTMQKCFRDLLMHFAIMALCTYFCALALTEASARDCFDKEITSGVCHYFGSLEKSTFSLYAAVFGGVAWGRLYSELRPLGFLYILLLLLFTASMTLAILNSVIAAVVTRRNQSLELLDYAREHEKVLHDNYIKTLKQIFRSMDVSDGGSISVEEMKLALRDPELVVLLDAMKLHIDDVATIFELLDADGDKGVDVDEFLFGCMRIRGAAKGSDMMKVLGQVESVKASVAEIKDGLDRVLKVSQASLLSHSSEKVNPRKTDYSRKPTQLQHSGGSIALTPESGFQKRLRSTVTCWKKGGGQRIPRVEQRAMCLQELRGVREIIELLCPREMWQEASTQNFLEPKDVNLYDFNNYVICPQTLPKGVTLSITSDTPCQEYDLVQQISDDKLLASGFVAEILPSGKLRVTVTWGRFQQGKSLVLNRGDNFAELREMEADHLSYKELTSSTPLDPDWWGESILDFVSCVERHVELSRASENKTGYWVCAYANDQHVLDLDMGTDLESSSFRKAMRLAKGTLLLLDPGAKAFTRIWCDYEIYKTFVDDKQFDVVAVSSNNRRPRVLLQQPAPGETSYMKTKREALFPVHILAHGMRVKLELGEASCQADKDKILQCMAADCAADSECHDHAGALQSALSKANSTLNAYFALAAWPLAISRKLLVNDFDRKNPGTLKLPEVLCRDQSRTRLVLSFSHVQDTSDDDLGMLAEGMPPGLEEVELHFKSCTRVTDRGFTSLMISIGRLQGLRKLHLDFTSCVRITDMSMLALAESLPPYLMALQLDFAVCTQISELGVRDLAQNLPDALQVFSASFKGTRFNRDFGTLDDIKALLDSTQSLTIGKRFTQFRSERHLKTSQSGPKLNFAISNSGSM